MLPGIAEIAFQVRDDWQGQGLGMFLFLKLVDIGRAVGMHSFKADVLGDNHGMRRVFSKAGIPYTTSTDFGVVSYKFSLCEDEKKMPI